MAPAHRGPLQVATTVSRIVQESLNDVFKHAKTQNVSVSVELRGDQLIGIVEADGEGLDTASPECVSAPRSSAASSL